MDKLFKGIQQVMSLPANPEKGVIYLVGNGDKGGKGTGIYFGTRWYGKTLDDIAVKALITRLETAEDKISAIEIALGEWTKEFEGDLQTVARVVKAHETKLVQHDDLIETANNNASTALETANTAKETAEGAVRDVTAQVQAAQTAQAAAEDAQSAAAQSATDAAGYATDAEAAQSAAEAAKVAAEAAQSAAENSNTSATAIATKAAQDAATALESVKDGANFKGKVDKLPSSFDDYNNGDIIVVDDNEYIAYKPKTGTPEWILLGNINPALEQITSSIEELDATVSDDTKKVTVTVVETYGKLTSVSVDDAAMIQYVDDAVSAIDHRLYYGGDDAE